MNWKPLTQQNEIEEIDKQSEATPILIFKHSTRCAISSVALSRIEREWKNDVLIVPYYLDLLAYRNVSNALAEKYNVEHQSPQVLLISKGKCIYNQSHTGIRFSELVSQL